MVPAEADDLIGGSRILARTFGTNSISILYVVLSFYEFCTCKVLVRRSRYSSQQGTCHKQRRSDENRCRYVGSRLWGWR